MIILFIIELINTVKIIKEFIDDNKGENYKIKELERKVPNLKGLLSKIDKHQERESVKFDARQYFAEKQGEPLDDDARNYLTDGEVLEACQECADQAIKAQVFQHKKKR